MGMSSVIGGILLLALGTIWIMSSFYSNSTAYLNAYAQRISPDVIINVPLPMRPTNWRRIMGIITLIIGVALIERHFNYTGLLVKK